MRTTKLIAAFLAVAAFVSSCKQDEDYMLPSIKVASETLDFSSGTEQSLGLVASRDWMIKSKPSWIAIDPDHGEASADPQWVTVTALPNDSYDRSEEIVFTIGLAKAAVTVTQPGAKGPVSTGSGTLEDPYSVAGVLAYVATLSADEESASNVYIKGKVASIKEEFSAQYGNGTFYLKDEDGDATFYVFRTMYLGNKKWTSGDKQVAVGDDVVVYGKVVNFKGSTPETVQNKSYIYSLNGETAGGGGDSSGEAGTPSGSGTLSDPYNVAGVLAYVNAMEDNGKSATDVYVKGTVSKVKEAYAAQFGNGTFYIKDADADADFYVYRALYLGNRKWTSTDTQIAVGDEVVICGKVTKYVSQYGTTPETVAGEAYLYSLNGKSEGGESGGGGDSGGDSGTASGSGTQADPYNPAAAVAAVANLTWTSNTDYQSTDEVYVKGKICEIASKGTYGESGDYGNASFYISEDGTTSGTKFYIFRALYFGKEKYTSGTDIKVGDEVIIKGKLMNYRGNTPETVAGEAYLYSLNGKTEGGGSDSGDQGGDEDQGGSDSAASGEGTLSSPYNAAAAVAAVANLTWTSNTEYEKTGKVYVKGKISKIADKGTFTEGGTYGNASFYISDDGTTAGTQFYVFRTLYLGNVKYTSGQTDIKVGDEVVIYGELMNYRGNTPETVQNASYLYSLNGKTE